MVAEAEADLRSRLGGDRVSTTWTDRLVRSRDASFYRLVPDVIVWPATVEHVRSLMAWSRHWKVPITIRAAGTSLSGQAVGRGAIVDVSRDWTASTVLDGGARIRLEPGITGGRANAILRPYGRRIGPDPASLQACMIGGIVANNASGMCCGIEQNTYRTLDSIGVVLADGTVVDTALADADEQLKAQAPSLYAELLRLRDVVRARPDLVDRIRSKYRIKNTMGYGLNAYLDYDRAVDILAHLLVGSEGTLGFVTHVVYRTVSEARHSLTGLALFPSIDEACQSVAMMRDAGAAAVELMDGASLQSVAGLPTTPAWLRDAGRQQAALLVEFQAETAAEAAAAVSRLDHDALHRTTLRPVVWTSDAAQRAALWSVRKGLMPTVGAMRPPGSTMINEDVAVPPQHLAALVHDLRDAFDGMGYHEAIIFGHAKDGNLHFVLNEHLDTPQARERYGHFMDTVASIVVGRYDGSLKAEHGTGRNMAPYVEQEWGTDLTAIMWDTKRAFDPDGILNPGVILDRNHTTHTENVKVVPVVDRETDRCIECGFCEHVCPSRTLTLTPRQRIVLRRELADPSLDAGVRREVERDHGWAVIDTCATDGLCGLVCPVGIDTGALVTRLRAERHGVPISRLAGVMACHFGLVDGLARAGTRLAYALGRVGRRPSKRPAASKVERHIGAILVPSCGSRWMGGTEGTSSLSTLFELAHRAGIGLTVMEGAGQHCCGQIFASKGHAEAAETVARTTVDALRAAGGGSRRVVVDATTCAGTLAERAPDVEVVDILDFITRDIAPLLTFRPVRRHVVLHPGCGARHNGTAASMISLAERCAERVTVPLSSACCGMAGDRGMRYPELVAAAMDGVRREVAGLDDVDGWYACNPTCEEGIERVLGRPVRSILALLEEASR